MTALLIPLIIGAVAGWLAGQLVLGTGLGLLRDILVGIVGAVAGISIATLGLGLGGRNTSGNYPSDLSALSFCWLSCA